MFGKKLKSLRLERGLSQKDISKIFNISASTIGMYEQGRRDPDTGLLKQLADYFDVTTDFLLGRTTVIREAGVKFTDKDKTIKTVEEPAYALDKLDISPEDIEMLQKFKKLPPAKRKEVDSFIRWQESKDEA